MKVMQTLLVSFISLVLIVGCRDIDEPSDSADLVSMQKLPADDDIEGLYNLGIPRGWFKIKDPVLYIKYFRAQLLRQFGNLREFHILADMELKKRQWIYPTRDEYITYLEATYRLFPDPGTLAALEGERRRKAEGKLFVLIYADAPAEHIIARLEEIYQRKLTREEAIFEVAVIKADAGTLQAFGLMKADMDEDEFDAWKAKNIDRMVHEDPFVPGRGLFKQFEELHNKKDPDEEDEDPDEEDPDA